MVDHLNLVGGFYFLETFILLGFLIWVAVVASQNDIATLFKTVKEDEKLLGIDYHYRDLEISFFAITGISILLLLVAGSIMILADRDREVYVDTAGTNYSIAVLTALLGLGLIVVGSLSFNNHEKLTKDYTSKEEKEAQSFLLSLKIDKTTEAIGYSGVIAGVLEIIMMIFFIVYYYYKITLRPPSVEENFYPPEWEDFFI